MAWRRGGFGRRKALALLLVAVYPWRGQLFARMLGPVVNVPCAVRTVSQIIRQHALDRLDLRKVDVEAAELDVLQGIERQHWPRIRQLAVQIAPAHRPGLPALTERLHEAGFTHVTDDSIPGGVATAAGALPSMLYAVRAPR